VLPRMIVNLDNGHTETCFTETFSLVESDIHYKLDRSRHEANCQLLIDLGGENHD
jgi:hypothetical protein